MLVYARRCVAEQNTAFLWRSLDSWHGEALLGACCERFLRERFLPRREELIVVYHLYIFLNVCHASNNPIFTEYLPPG